MRRHAFAHAANPGAGYGAGSDGDQPFSAMNTTPLIDVLLVLLIMIILTIPMQANEIPLNLPQSGPAKAAVTHRLALDRAGAVTLDGVALAEPALTARLRTIATVGDVLTVRTDPAARYDRFAQTLTVVKRAGITRLGFEGGKPADF